MRCSEITRVSPVTAMKLVSPNHRGTMCMCRCSSRPAPAARPRTHPIVLPTVDVAELGVADRLGLSDEDDEEVGPTS